MIVSGIFCPRARRRSPLPLLCLCFFALLLPACTPLQQQDVVTLRAQIQKEAPEFAFNADDLFFRDGCCYCYYSFYDENDLLLTMRENENKKIDRVTLTARRDSPAATEELPAFALLLARLLITDCDAAALEEATGLRALCAGAPPAAGDGSPAAYYDCGSYRATLFTEKYAFCFLIEKRRPEPTTQTDTAITQTDDGIS